MSTVTSVQCCRVANSLSAFGCGVCGLPLCLAGFALNTIGNHGSENVLTAPSAWCTLTPAHLQRLTAQSSIKFNETWAWNAVLVVVLWILKNRIMLIGYNFFSLGYHRMVAEWARSSGDHKVAVHSYIKWNESIAFRRLPKSFVLKYVALPARL